MGNWYQDNCFVFPSGEPETGSTSTVRLHIEWTHPVGKAKPSLRGRAWLRPIKSGKRRTK